MSYMISDVCISCGACAENCPAECIEEGETKYEIDSELCVECGACRDVCPVDAPYEAS